jgi:hypothetical protein
MLPSSRGLGFSREEELPLSTPFEFHLCVPPESTSCADFVNSCGQRSSFSVRLDAVDVMSSGGFAGRYGPGNKKSTTSAEDCGELWRDSEIREKNAAEVDWMRFGGLKGSKSFGWIDVWDL